MTAAHPLAWPDGWARTPARLRKAKASFGTTFDKARHLLFRDLELLGASNVVVSSWLPLRLDGLPRADQARRQLEDPGVAVYFTMRKRQMVMARDAYATVHDNLRSIGLALNYLRGMERHGGATMMERAFDGFTALPSPAAPRKRPWREVLVLEPTFPGSWADPKGVIEIRYRELAKRRHPDTPGGSNEAMAELNAAIAEARKELGR